MIILAVIGVLILVALACVGVVCALFDADDLHNMGIQL
jgi:hypothetical protein